MKTLYTAADIEALAASGQRTLALGPNAILTPLARDRARELGVQLRWGQSAAPSPLANVPAPPLRRRVAQPSGLAADARDAYCALAQQARDDVSDIPHLARCFENLLRAVEQGAPVQPSWRVRPADLDPERRRALAGRVEKMHALGHYLFGPDSPHRRFDILWALEALRAMVND
jgi:hypothetical protein